MATSSGKWAARERRSTTPRTAGAPHICPRRPARSAPRSRPAAAASPPAPAPRPARVARFSLRTLGPGGRSHWSAATSVSGRIVRAEKRLHCNKASERGASGEEGGGGAAAESRSSGGGSGGRNYLPRVNPPQGRGEPTPPRSPTRPAPAPPRPPLRQRRPRPPGPPAAARSPCTGGPRARWQIAERFPKPFSMATLATGADSPSRECCGIRGARAARTARRAARRRRRGPGWRPPRRQRPRCGRAGPWRGKVSAPASVRRRRLAAALLPFFDHHLISTGNDMENGRKRRLGQTRTPQFRGRSGDSAAASQPGPGENSRAPAAPARARPGGGNLAPRTQKERASFIIQPAEKSRKKINKWEKEKVKRTFQLGYFFF